MTHESPRTDDDLAETGELARLFVRIADRARAEFTIATAHLDLPVQLTRTILVLVEGMSMREIAEQVGFDPSYVTALVDQLEERGLATRRAGKDRRVKLVTLTADGAALREQIAASVSGKGLFARQLTPDERQQLHTILERLNED
jgi:Transcriptional regulators